jgi:hypothetical protein
MPIRRRKTPYNLIASEIMHIARTRGEFHLLPHYRFDFMRRQADDLVKNGFLKCKRVGRFADGWNYKPTPKQGPIFTDWKDSPPTDTDPRVR